MKPPAINWVVALKPELRPLISHLGLTHNAQLSGAGFSVYSDRGDLHRVILSGVGKVNAAASVAFLGARLSSNTPEVWINFGIAGNREAEPGKVFRGGRIEDAGSGKSWYPPLLAGGRKRRFPDTEIITLDRPVSEYPESIKTVEMEASGFLSAALRFTSIELIQVVKVVSDNASTGWKNLNPGKVQNLCEATVADVAEWAEPFRQLGVEEQQRLGPVPGVEEVLQKYRFSETEKHQLKKLARRAVTLGLLSDFAWEVEKRNPASGKQILSWLSEILSGRVEG